MLQNPITGETIFFLQTTRQLDQGTKLRFSGLGRSARADRIIVTAKVSNQTDSDVRVVSFRMRSLNKLRSPLLNSAVGKNHIVIPDMVEPSPGKDFIAPRLMYSVDRGRIDRSSTKSRNHRYVMNNNSCRYY